MNNCNKFKNKNNKLSCYFIKLKINIYLRKCISKSSLYNKNSKRSIYLT